VIWKQFIGSFTGAWWAETSSDGRVPLGIIFLACSESSAIFEFGLEISR